MDKNQQIELYTLIKESYEVPISSHKFTTLTEAEQLNISKNLIDQMYVTIAERYNTVDFSIIPKSLGKITTMKAYANLSASLTMLDNIAKESRQNIPEIETLKEALSNMEKFEEKFYLGFMRKNVSIIMTYNIFTMALYCGTSLMISVLVDYINGVTEPNKNTDTVNIVISKKYTRNQSYLMIDSLAKFNEQVKNGNFLKVMEFNTRQNANNTINEGFVVSAVTVLAIYGLLKIIPLIKELIYIFFYSRLKISDALQIQADLVSGNVDTLKYKGIDQDNRIYRTQKWVADKLSKLSNFFAFTYEKSEKRAQIDSSQKLNTDDLILF
jgi:hypothetical protein